MVYPRCTALLFSFVAMTSFWESNHAGVEGSDSFAPIATLLVDQCYGCHNEKQKDGGYSIETLRSLFESGESGRLPFDADAPELGEVIRRIRSDDESVRMPRDSERLPQQSVDRIIEWLKAGADVPKLPDVRLESVVDRIAPSSHRFEHYPKPLPIRAITLDVSRRRVMTSGYFEVLVYSFEGELLLRIPSSGRFVSDLEWSPSQERLFVACGEPGKEGVVESFVILKDKGGHEGNTSPLSLGEHRVLFNSRDVPFDIALSPNQERLAIGTQDGVLTVLNAIDGTTQWSVPSHAAAITSVDWTASGENLMTSSRDRMAKSYDATNGQVQTSYVDHERTVSGIRALDIGVVTFDEAGSFRLFPGTSSPNSRASRGGFAQRTPKITSTRHTLHVPVDREIRRFQFRREEIVESKDADGKEKKKTVFHIDERDRLRIKENSSSQIFCVAVDGSSSEIAAAGFADGAVAIWTEAGSEPIVFVARP